VADRFARLIPNDNVYVVDTAADLPDILSQWRIYHLRYDPGTGVGLYFSPDGVILLPLSGGGGGSLPVGTIQGSTLFWDVGGAVWLENTSVRWSGTALQLNNTVPIDWLDFSGLPREFLVLNANSPIGDPDFASVIFLTSLDGADGATAAVDKSNANRVMTFLGGSALSNIQPRFGPTALRLQASADRVSMVNDPDLVPDVAYTIEAQFYIDSGGKGLGQTHSILGYRTTGAQHGWMLRVDSSNEVSFFGYGSGNATPVISIQSVTTVVADQYYHVAVSRDAFGNWELFLDGVSEGTGVETSVITNTVQPFFIGRDFVNSSRTFEGWIDEVRITRGVDRYTGPFTPPTAEFLTAGGSGGDFTVGDPSFETIIDGNPISFHDLYDFPQLDGSVDQILQTDGLGQLSFVDLPSGLSRVGITIENPLALDNFTLFFTDVAITIEQINFVLQGSTDATVFVSFGPDRSTTPTDVVNAGTVVVNTTVGQELTAFDNAAIPADSWVVVRVTAITDTPDELNVSVIYS